MKALNQWITYRTRFLVQAKQLTTGLSFTDALGRQHSGGKGDYLVETSDGFFRIVPRQIFQDVYVALLPQESNPLAETQPQSPPLPPKITRRNHTQPPFAGLPPKKPLRRRDLHELTPLSASIVRKSPQPERHSINSNLHSL